MYLGWVRVVINLRWLFLFQALLEVCQLVCPTRLYRKYEQHLSGKFNISIIWRWQFLFVPSWHHHTINTKYVLRLGNFTCIWWIPASFDLKKWLKIWNIWMMNGCGWCFDGLGSIQVMFHLICHPIYYPLSHLLVYPLFIINLLFIFILHILPLFWTIALLILWLLSKLIS